MPDSPPTPPGDLPDELVDALDECPPDRLRAFAAYAEALATHRERTAEAEGSEDARRTTDNRPDDVPAKATLTVKEINDNRYDYWQWREGDTVKSKYKGPVSGSK
jgi:hypothetical protein